MQEKEIHIVAFNIPYPPNYGGIIDVFYKIKTLHKLGIIINLHCFKYDRPEAKELEKYCKSVEYYKRPICISHYLSKLPFIVKTRSDNKLIQNLLNDSLPILFEGLHTTYFLKKILKNKNRSIIVRTHNIEHDYYTALACKERNVFKKIYFKTEARKLKAYEAILGSKITIAAITEKDKQYFNTLNSNSFLIPAFHPYSNIETKQGKGNYILFHGDLSVNENINSVHYLLNNITPKGNYKFIIAGRNPSKKIKKLITKHGNIELFANPNEIEMKTLVQNAHINLLLTDQATGIKLKLINSLFSGRFCVCNELMTLGTQLEKLCFIKNNPNEIIDCIHDLMLTEFTEDDIIKRKQTLLKIVNNTENAQKLINLL